MKDLDKEYLLTALEAAVSECRRLTARVRELERRLKISHNDEEQDEVPVQKNRRSRKGGRTYRPWQKKEEPLPIPQIEVAHRRGVNDIYREQKEKHEAEVARVAREAAAAFEQEQLAEEAYESSEERNTPVEVRLSNGKKQFLIEAGKIAMSQTGN